MIGEDVLVVFEVLPQLLVRRAFQPVLEFLQRMLAIELIRCAGVVVRQRQVGRVMRFDAERDADQLRGHPVEAGGFGVDAHQRRGHQLVQPGIELGIGEDGFVVGGVVDGRRHYSLRLARERARRGGYSLCEPCPHPNLPA